MREEDLLGSKEGVKHVLKGMSSIMEQEEIDFFTKLVDNSELEKFNDYQDIYLGLTYPFQKFIKRLISETISSEGKVVFLVTNSRFVERQFSNIIEKIEGGSCSRDKSRTIMRSLIDFYKNGKFIEFDYSIERSYQLPKKVFTEHDEIIEFFKSIHSLYYGNSSRFVELSMRYLSAQKDQT